MKRSPAPSLVGVALLFVALTVSGCATGRKEHARRIPERNVPSIWPVRYPDLRITSRFGDARDANHHHNGIDIAAPKGTPVLAAANGKVISREQASGYGRLVRIAHGDGLETWYAHLQSWNVKPGKKMKCGQRIGKVGKSGNATAPHLHYEVRINGRPVNPEVYLP